MRAAQRHHVHAKAPAGGKQPFQEGVQALARQLLPLHILHQAGRGQVDHMV